MININRVFGRIPIRIKLLILTLGLATLPLGLFYALSFMLGFHEMRDLAIKNLHREAEFIKEQTVSHFNRFAQDTTYLSRSPFIRAFIKGLDTSQENLLRKSAEQHLSLFAKSNPNYYQLRYIDEEGFEKLRVNQKNGKLTITPIQELQRKHNRYYFQEAIKTKPGDIYVSPMDYNIEHGRLELPKTPVFRYASRVSVDGQNRGIFIINVFGQAILDILPHGETTNPAYQRLSVLDNQNRMIVSSSQHEGQLHMFLMLEQEGKSEGSILSKSFDIDREWNNEEFDRLFIRLSINPLPDYTNSGWTLVLEGDRDAYLAPIFRYGYYNLGFLIFASLIAIAAGLLAARHFYKPLLQLRDGAKRVSGGDYNISINVGTNDEIEDLANDFNRMTKSLEDREQEINTHQKELENLVARRTFQIRLEKEKLERVVEGVGAGLVLLNQQNRVLWFNEYFNRMLGQGAFNVGDNCCSIFSDKLESCLVDQNETDKHPYKHCLVQQVLAGKSVEESMREILCGDGKTRIFLDRISPIHDETGKVIYALHVLYDVTEKERMGQRESQLQAQLARAEKMATLGRFTAGIAHEIGNPLGIISTNAQAIQEDLEENGEMWGQLELIRSEIERLSKITRDLHTFGKPSPPNMVAQNPGNILVGLQRLVEKEGAANGVKVITEIPHLEESILVDSQQLQQVILNLVVNAFEAMPNGGELRLGIQMKTDEENGAKLLFIVSDTGEGIPEKNLDLIFDPFFTTKTQGTGFGLALASTIVDKNKGVLTVSCEPGKGSTFTIALPLATDTVTRELEGENDAPPSAALGGD